MQNISMDLKYDRFGLSGINVCPQKLPIMPSYSAKACLGAT
jgi:hypothetical protein